MKERPILFAGPMVRALLAGTKTQTRRVVKPQPDIQHWQSPFMMSPKGGKARCRPVAPDWPDGVEDDFYCPYGQPGDRLWVRETWAPNLVMPIEHRPAGDYLYAATNAGRYAVPRWKPSIHMPRWASRITLEITAVRVERLQEISVGDAIAEGIERGAADGYWRLYGRETNGDMDRSPRVAYRSLWESINGPGSWEANPWVWCVSFRRIL